MFCKVAGIIISAIAAGAYAAPIDECAVLVPNLPPGVGPFCQNCDDGFLNKDGKECAPCETDNCKVCQPPEGEDCTQCKFPYTLIDGECLFLVCGVAEEPDLTFPCSPNCANCPAGNQPFCQECDEGYWNDNGYCKPCCTVGCAVCQPPTGEVCTQCQVTNLPAVNGVC